MEIDAVQARFSDPTPRHALIIASGLHDGGATMAWAPQNATVGASR